HHAIGGRKPACDHGIAFILLRHHDRLCGGDVAVTDDVAEGAGGAALHRRRRHDDRLRQGFDFQPHVDELPGQSLKFALGNSAFSFSVPVVGSTWLSMPFSVPVSTTVTPSLPNTSTSSAPLPAAALTRTICCCGRLNWTAIGCSWVMITRPVTSDARMMLPWSTWRRPTRPVSGAMTFV